MYTSAYSNKGFNINISDFFLALELLLPQSNTFSSLFIVDQNASDSLQFSPEVEALSSQIAFQIPVVQDQNF